MKFCVLASGSKGNCTAVTLGKSTILIDCGLREREFFARLSSSGIDPESIKGIFVTHEHSDHISGVYEVAKRTGAKVFANALTAEKMQERLRQNFDIESDFETGIEFEGFYIKAFRVPHDAEYTVGYRIEGEGVRFGIATDLGGITDGIIKGLSGCEAVVIESNHDLNMLRCGRYPYHLKRRIESINGHLSNDECAKTSFQLFKNGTKQLVLGHISEDNNNPELAFTTTNDYLASQKVVEGKEIFLSLALQAKPTKVFEI